MNFKKNIAISLLVLFFSILIGAFSNSSVHEEIDLKGAIAQGSSQWTHEQALIMEGMLQSSVNAHETSIPVFRVFKNEKKYFALSFSFLSTVFSKIFFDSYSLQRASRISISPFYIAYRRMII